MLREAISCINSMRNSEVNVKWFDIADNILVLHGIDIKVLRKACENRHDDGSVTDMLSSVKMLFLPEVVKRAKRLLLIDADYIFTDDISKVWNADLNGNPVGAMHDLWENTMRGISNWQELGINPDAPYFNGGFIMADLEHWDMDGIVKCINDNMDVMQWWDQYVFNVVYS